ncbi:alpha/beta fold hydrolase [Jiangella gansuensis]|uniref:alpha/beta fold hydrolase n=1 Tax=Jiangella gansuensis TaxID=281473 RepID=UPI0004B173A0|nr:alpha/beta hydrolase [Jiangella gansuensis]
MRLTARSADGTSIAVTRANPDTRPALVMIDPAGAFHGLRPMAEAVAPLAAGFTVYTYDRRGRGDSGDAAGALPYSPLREVEDLAAVIDLAGGDAYVYGFSSGAAVALRAAAEGLPIPKLALMEPPFAVDQPSDDAFVTRLRQLLDAGERGAAVEFFNRGAGVPEHIVKEMRDHPAWPGLVALAHTLLYDVAVLESMTADLLASVHTPTVVISSSGSDDYLRGTSADVAGRLPQGEHREVAGGWHGVADADLARVLSDWFR